MPTMPKGKWSGWTDTPPPPNRERKMPVKWVPAKWPLPLSPVQKKDMEEEEQLEFMQECRERTAATKDEEKCDHCKLRFRCYTEIKVKKKRKTRVRKPKPESPDDAIGSVIDGLEKLYIKKEW